MSAPSRNVEVWTASDAPDRPSGFVIADGLNTSGSTGFPPRFLTKIGPEIVKAVPDALVRGFSYSRPGWSYDPWHTNYSLLSSDPQEKVGAYTSLTHKGTSYVAFSFSGPTHLLGMEAALRAWGGSNLDEISLAKHLILVQPALTIRQKRLDDLMQLPLDEDFEMPYPIVDHIDQDLRRDVAERIGSALAFVASRIAVTLLYWPDDPWLDYTGWPERFQAANARRVVRLSITMRPYSLTGRLPEDLRLAFAQHVMMPNQPITREAIRQQL